jgi:hypothetical protein
MLYVPKYISFNDKYWLVIHFSVKIQNIFELIVNIIILRSKPQEVIKYAKHLNLNVVAQCVWATYGSTLEINLVFPSTHAFTHKQSWIWYTV